MEKKLSVLVISVLLFCLFLPPVSAVQYISFAQPDTLTQKDLYLYGFNTTSATYELLGLYNTTSSGIELPNGTDVMFILKPQYGTPLDNPLEAFGSALAFLETYWIQIGVSVFLIGLFVAGTRR